MRKLSAKQITVPQAYDALKNAQPGGPYDKALGPLEQHDRCVPGEAQHTLPVSRKQRRLACQAVFFFFCGNRWQLYAEVESLGE